MARTFRVYAIPCAGIENSSARTRLYDLLPYLSAQGVRVHIPGYHWHKYEQPGSTVRSHWWKRLWLELLPFRNATAFMLADAVYMQKQAIYKPLVMLSRLFGKRLIYDLDDAIYLTPPGAEDGDRSARAAAETLKRIQFILKRADVVLVSGQELAEFARRTARDVRILPTLVSRVVRVPSTPAKPPVIGWVGAPENLAYIKPLESVIRQLQEEITGLEVWIITSRQADPPLKFEYRFIPWSLGAEAEMIPLFTVGIAPLADDLWCRAKMNYKALVYLSHGVPVVMSPIGFPLAEIADHLDEMTAQTETEWYDRLKRLLLSDSVRNRAAQNGIEVLKKRFTAESRCSAFVRALTGSSEN